MSQVSNKKWRVNKAPSCDKSSIKFKTYTFQLAFSILGIFRFRSSGDITVKTYLPVGFPCLCIWKHYYLAYNIIYLLAGHLASIISEVILIAHPLVPRKLLAVLAVTHLSSTGCVAQAQWWTLQNWAGNLYETRRDEKRHDSLLTALGITSSFHFV